MRDRCLRGEGTGAVDLPQNWATTLTDGTSSVGLSVLERENEALRKSLELLEENASLRRRIDELAA